MLIHVANQKGFREEDGVKTSAFSFHSVHKTHAYGIDQERPLVLKKAKDARAGGIRPRAASGPVEWTATYASCPALACCAAGSGGRQRWRHRRRARAETEDGGRVGHERAAHSVSDPFRLLFCASCKNWMPNPNGRRHRIGPSAVDS